MSRVFFFLVLESVLSVFLSFYAYYKCIHLVLLLAANCNWQVSSLSETKAHQLMQQKATSFIRFNQQQLSRIYPSSYRVDSSNFNPQPFWNAGCQLGMRQLQHCWRLKVLYCFVFLTKQWMSFQLPLTTRQKAEFCSSTEQSSTATATVATC